MINNIKIFTIGNEDYGNWMSYNSVKDLLKADLVVFTGGSDVSPSIYEESAHPTTNCDAARDFREIDLFNLCVDNKIPIMGICRGSQFVSVMNGAKLVQNVDGHALWGTHKVEFDDGSIMRCTSTHHQMMMPFNLDKKEYKIIAKSYPERSSFYQTGFGEYSKEEMLCEPEIILYPKTKSLAIQAHPESMSPDSEFVVRCKELIIEYLL